MSGAGSPALQVHAPDVRVAVVAASWHEVVMAGLLGGARRALADAGVRPESVTEIRVPGSFELGVACARVEPAYDGLKLVLKTEDPDVITTTSARVGPA